MQKTDLPRDRATLKANKITLKTPYTAKPVVDFALKLPSGQKISKTQTKIIIRELAKSLGLPTELAERKKCAAQYGSGFDKAIKKLAKKSGYKSRSKYLYQFRKKPNLKLAALFSSGKDSTYAMQIVTNQNYEISCIVTIHSSNPDSYMYHTPNIEFATLQAKAMQKPIIIKKTPGKKEKELRELELALKEAIKKYKIKGVVCGAIHSTYQRDRIQKICEKLNLRLFAPLWQKTQENEIRECITAGIKFIPVKISAHGLDKTWLGRETTHSDVDKLVALDKKFGFNIAFEGGEAETFVLDSPLFKKRIKITDSEITEESENNASLIIKKAELAEK